MDELTRRQVIDEEHLRLLGIFYYVSAAITAMYACLPIFHVVMGIVFIVIGKVAPSDDPNAPPPEMGWFLVFFAGAIILLGWCIAFLKFLTGRYIRQRRNRVFCMAVGVLSCLAIPYGTILGVLTMIVLSRESTKALFTPGPPAEERVA